VRPEIVVAAVVVGLGQALFSRFEVKTHPLRLLARWLLYFTIAAVLAHKVGEPWSWLWTLGLPLLGFTVHAVWCRRHGIRVLAPEPKERYYKLRGWS
jgi:hypothetical protein